MKQCIDIPRGWQRVIKSQIVVYITPSHDELKSKDDILQYLTSPGTCKCGLQCPLHLDSLFSFDASVKSKDNHNKTSRNNTYSQQNKSRADLPGDAVKGPPVSHSCNLKSSKSSKLESANRISLANHPNPLAVKQIVSDENSDSNHKTAINDNIKVYQPNRLPPISIFCQVNKYTVNQVLHHLYMSLENTSNHLRASLNRQNSNQQESARVDQVYRDNRAKALNERPTPCVQDQLIVNTKHVPTSNFQQQNMNVPNRKEMLSVVPNSCATSTMARNNLEHENSKSKQIKPFKSQFQIVQNEPPQGPNCSYAEPPQYNINMKPIQSRNSVHNVMPAPISNVMTKDHGYIHNHLGFHRPTLPDDRQQIRNRVKTKSKQLQKCSRQPAIVIETDHGKSVPETNVKPTLLVSLREKITKKGDQKHSVKNQSLPTSDPNLTSVDSILKTCSNTNLNNLPDIDENSVSVTICKSVDSQAKPVSCEASAAPYNTMIPPQYLTPGNLVYGVPLLQGEPKVHRDNKTKCAEKWEGVLSPSEVDAKVQQILSSPQKVEDSAQSADKDLSPKKRKRQQSAPHMYDRYPGNPSLRFQTGSSIKSSKSSKSEPQTPLPNVMMSSVASGPIIHQIPVPYIQPHWGQYPHQMNPHNFHVYQAMANSGPIVDPEFPEGRSSR